MKKVLAVLPAALLCGALTVSAAETKDVTMAFCTWTGYSPMFIAQENGYFEEEGVNVDIQVIEDESTYAAPPSTPSWRRRSIRRIWPG